MVVHNGNWVWVCANVWRKLAHQWILCTRRRPGFGNIWGFLLGATVHGSATRRHSGQGESVIVGVHICWSAFSEWWLVWSHLEQSVTYSLQVFCVSKLGIMHVGVIWALIWILYLCTNERVAGVAVGTIKIVVSLVFRYCGTLDAL